MIDLLYDYPYASFLLLFLIGIVFLGWGLHSYRERFHLKLMISRSTLLFWVKVFALCGVWAFGVFALMAPKGNGRYSKGFEGIELRKSHDVILLFDVSASMLAEDTRTGQTRFDMAKDVADDLVSHLEGENVALYAFTSDISQLTPPTLDYLFTRFMLQDMQINEGGTAGTDFFEAIARIRDEFSPKKKTLIILSDGGDTRLQDLEESIRKKEIEAIQNLLDDPTLDVFTIGFGSTEGKKITVDELSAVTRLDDHLLKSLGSYYEANQYSTVKIAQEITRAFQKVSLVEEEDRVSRGKEMIYDHYFQRPLMIAILLLGFFLFYPNTRKTIVTLFLLITFPLIGQEIEKLPSWQQKILQFNEATHSLEEGNYEDAISQFNSIPINPNDPVQFKEKILRNLIVANYEYAKVLRQNEEYQKAISLLRDSLELAENQPLLIPNIKQRLAITLKEYRNFWIEKLTVEESVPLMISQMKTIKKMIPTLEKGDYLEWFVEQQKTWTPLWKEKKLKESFDLVIASLETQNFNQTIKYADQTIELLKSIMEPETLSSLYLSYQNALSYVPLQEWSLIALQQEQDQVDLDLSQAKGFLKSSIEALQNGKRILARFYLEEGKQNIYRLLPQPENPLEVAVNEQEHAIRLNQLYQRIPEKSSELETLSTITQNLAVNKAKTFSSWVYKKQVEDFQKEKICQDSPWDKVLPVYNEGMIAAMNGFQDKALKKWEEALKLMKEPPSPSSCHMAIEHKPEERDKASLQEVMQYLQRMEQDDKHIRPEQKPPKKGTKPW